MRMPSCGSGPAPTPTPAERLDAYLNIAENVLGNARRPLTPREILNHAYTEHMVPPHLHGRTQHKTLGARLSEDILIRRERSAFFRTNPGQFFLRRFLTDVGIPEKYRTPIIARRRERELQRGTILCLDAADLPAMTGFEFSVKLILNLLRSNRFHYLDGLERGIADVVVWSFVVIARKSNVLTYRIGRYRDGRDSFLRRRSIGFFRPVRDCDRTLFDLKDHGIVSSGVRAASIDLDLPQDAMDDDEYGRRSDLSCFLYHRPSPKLQTF